MKKSIKFIILSTIVFIFGFYIVLNNINVKASTYYSTIENQDLTTSNSSITINSNVIELNDGITDISFKQFPNTIYKPTNLGWNYYSSYYSWVNENNTTLWDKYRGSFSISTTEKTTKVNTTFPASSDGSTLRLKKLSCIQNLSIYHESDNHVDLIWDTLASSESNTINIPNDKSSILLLMEFVEYDYRGVPFQDDYYPGTEDTLYWDKYCYYIAYIEIGSSLEESGKYVTSKNIQISNSRIYYYNEGETNPSNSEYISNDGIKTLSEEGKYKITKYLSSGAIDKTFYLYIVKNKEIEVCDKNGNKITQNNQSNETNVYLKFKTSLHKNYLKEIIDSISINDLSYSGDTKNNIIENGKITVTPNIELTCKINDGSFFNSYDFYIDTISPEFNIQPLEEQDIINISTTNYLTAKAVRITWDNSSYILKSNKELKNGSYDELNNFFYYNLTSPGSYELTLTDLAGNSTTKFLYIKDDVFLTGVTQNNTLDLTELRNNPYFYEIKFDPSYNIFSASNLESNETVSYTITLNGEPYTKNTLIKEEGKYNLHVEYSIGSSYDFIFTIDRTSPYMNVEYLKMQGYGSLNSWYNTTDENGITYSFSYYNVSEENRIGAWQYAWQREQNYFTDIIDYDPNWNHSSSKLGLDNLTPADLYTGETKIYIYKKSSGNGYVYYHQYANYLNTLETVVRNSIKECYSFKNSEFNPYPDDRYFEYLTFIDGTTNYPIFYMNEAYTFNKSKEEIGETSIDLSIYNGATKNKIEASGLYKVIETDKAGNSTIYFIYYQENALTSIDIIYQGTNYNYNTYLFKDDITISPNLKLNTYNPISIQS